MSLDSYYKDLYEQEKLKNERLTEELVRVEADNSEMKEKLDNSYKAVDIPYTSSFEYAPSIKNSITGESKNVLEYAKSIIGTGRTRIYAKPLDTYIKLFTTWDEDKYYSGLPGDYIAVREDDPYDTYIINGRLFDQLYKEVEA